MGKLRVTQIKSVIDRTKKQKATIQAIGLKKINHSVEVENTAQMAGMLSKVSHLVTVEEI